MSINPLEFTAPEGFSAPEYLGRQSRLGFVELSKLVVAGDYQRPVDDKGRRHVLAIASAFDWALFGAIVVCPLGDERFAIIDGQHRALAALAVGAQKVPCIVIFGDHRAQARAFAAINGVVKAVTLFNIYRAALAAGEEWAVAARDLAAQAGCRLMDYNRPNHERKPGELYCISFLKMICEEGVHSPRYSSAGGALQGLRQSKAGQSPAVYAATPVQAWISAVYQIQDTRHADWARLMGCLNAHDLPAMIDHAHGQVSARRQAGAPTISILEQLTGDLVDMLDAWFTARGRA